VQYGTAFCLPRHRRGLALTVTIAWYAVLTKSFASGSGRTGALSILCRC
jgi:hypothetical protein